MCTAPVRSVGELYLLDRDAGGRHAERPDLEVVRVLAVAKNDPAVQATRLGRAGAPVHAPRERCGDGEAVGAGVARLHATSNGGVLLTGRLVGRARDRGVTATAVRVVLHPVDGTREGVVVLVE